MRNLYSNSIEIKYKARIKIIKDKYLELIKKE